VKKVKDQKGDLTVSAATAYPNATDSKERLAADRLCDVKDVAEFLGLAPNSIYHMASEGRLPVVRISARCLKFRPSEILAWIERKSQKENNVEVKIKEGNLLILLDLEEPKLSATGKTEVVAGTGGRWRSGAKINGKSVWVVASAYVYPDKTLEPVRKATKRDTQKKSDRE
jgi:predicted DNA-binding transcriptional regulator AlpA